MSNEMLDLAQFCRLGRITDRSHNQVTVAQSFRYTFSIQVQYVMVIAIGISSQVFQQVLLVQVQGFQFISHLQLADLRKVVRLDLVQ